MALFKSKTARRSSSSSYTSTLTTLVFVALCVVGVWMLSSNSVISPTNQAGSDDSDSNSNNIAIHSNIDNSELTNNDITSAVQESAETAVKNVQESAETATKAVEESVETAAKTVEEALDQTTTVSKIQEQNETQTFGDNPGHLPDDAIKSDDKNPNINDAQISEESSLTQKQAVAEITETATNTDSKKSEENREPEIVNVSENIQQNFDAQEQSKQSKEDNGEMIEIKDQKQQENSDSTIDTSRQEPQISVKEQSSELPQEEPKPKKNKKKKHKGHKSTTLPKESKKSWSTQAVQSQKEKEVQDQTWVLCNVTAGTDYIPCLDNEAAINKLHSRKHFEHRERHCPEEAPTCLVPIPKGYKRSIEWPASRDKIWYHNVPHTLLAQVKGHQNWVKVSGEFLTFPGGGTQFIHGALHYIDFLQEAEPKIGWGKHTRVVLDVGCGVGSFGGFLFERDVVTMSFAPKDEHEAQVQFGLERGIAAISAVMGSQRLQFPSNVFDLVHCARCRVPWHADGGLLLLELNRVLRPGGYFVWSATPVYQKLPEDVKIWNDMTSLTKAMCWELVTIKKDTLNQVAAAVYRKPTSNKCYEERENNDPPMCKVEDDPDAAWYVPLVACMHRIPMDKAERGTKWPEPWPRRLKKPPYWLNDTQIGVYGKPTPQDFLADNDRWKNVVDEITNFGITWSNVRNIMDMRAVYGGFAAALRDLPVWVFNIVNVNAADTLPIIYERGLFGMYHDWCESFSTYPRTYDLLHADNLFSQLKTRCNLVPVLAEVDRIVRPEGKLIVRDESSTIEEVESLLKSLHWEITISKTQEGILCAKKGYWRPDT